MREIKFRGKRVDNGEWVYGYYMRDDSHKDELRNVIYQTPEFIPVIPETVGQFTGLTDKNGKEIYEGDVYITEGDFDKEYIVAFDGSAFCGGTMEKGYIPLCWDYNHDKEDLEITDSWITGRLEVIGNIHDK